MRKVVLYLYLILMLYTSKLIFFWCFKSYLAWEGNIIKNLNIHVQLQLIFFLSFIFIHVFPCTTNNISLLIVGLTFKHIAIIDRKTQIKIVLITNINIRLMLNFLERFGYLWVANNLILELSNTRITKYNKTFCLGEFKRCKMKVEWCCRTFLYLQRITLCIKCCRFYRNIDIIFLLKDILYDLYRILLLLQR